ncbi:AMP-binding protein [Tomitella cavernea]|uniref:AMP-binding protein n=1 Tax=Tomitella cavernea TaxID=1387982 RepID=A0ABP9CHV6_9ACTN|nr:AMP-binding protein [Tomitella cavernea]
MVDADRRGVSADRGQSSYAQGEGAPPLLEQTIGANLAATTVRHPEREALVDCAVGLRWNYTELRTAVRRLAAGLLRTGVRTGDRVGIWAPNRWEWVIVQFATAEIGAVLVNINPAYRAFELEYALEKSGITAVFAAESFKDSDYRAMLDEVAPRCPVLTDVVYLGSDRWAELADRPLDAADEAAVNAAAARLDRNDPINIQYTSGTTGRPKGATLTHRNILNNGFMVGELIDYTEHDRICIPVPFYHCFGMVMGNLAATSRGAAMVIPAPGFDPRATLRAVQDERCTSLYGVPTMFIAELGLADFDTFDLSSLRTGIMAGSTCPAEVMRKVIDRMNMKDVSICYGMTETSPVSTQTRTADTLEQRVGTVGRAGPHVEVKVVDPADGSTLPRGEAGEFCSRGYIVMRGYWEDQAKTSEAIDAEGWMHTGDLAVMDDDGYLSITGRIKDMVIRGGENIYPREIEEFLYTHPDIVDAQVIGVPDEKFGEELMVWIKLRDGADALTADGLREYCRGRLAHFKIPRYVHIVDEFPMTVTGKIRKVQMRTESLELIGKK